MKQQVFVIHGGDVFSSREKFVEALRSWSFSLEDLRKKGWKDRLADDLGGGFDVLLAKMPNKQSASYQEWKTYFEKFLPLLNDDVIFVGHSLGGMFLAKYFGEEGITKKFRSIFFVAAPGPKDEDTSLKEFAVPQDLSSFSPVASSLYFYHSKDDKVVSFSNMERYMHEIPEAHFRIFEDKGHFNQESFPEIIKDIIGRHLP